MKYMVIETHLGYAVVLSEKGQFIKTANFDYEVGQMVDQIFEMKEPENSFFSKIPFKSALVMMSAVAVLILAVIMNQPITNQAIGYVILKINPEVRINIKADNHVIDVEGVNQDGKDLVVDYDPQSKHVEIVMEELIDKAIADGYLSDGSQITLTYNSEDEQWILNSTSEAKNKFVEYTQKKVQATIIVGENLTNDFEVIIPVEHTDYQERPVPTEPTPQPIDESDDDDVSDYEGATDYDDVSDYEVDDVSDYEYDDSDYEIDD